MYCFLQHKYFLSLYFIRLLIYLHIPDCLHNITFLEYIEFIYSEIHLIRWLSDTKKDHSLSIFLENERSFTFLLFCWMMKILLFLWCVSEAAVQYPVILPYRYAKHNTYKAVSIQIIGTIMCGMVKEFWNILKPSAAENFLRRKNCYSFCNSGKTFI